MSLLGPFAEPRTLALSADGDRPRAKELTSLGGRKDVCGVANDGIPDGNNDFSYYFSIII